MKIDEFCQEYGLEKNEAGNYVYISENGASKIDLGLILEELKRKIIKQHALLISDQIASTFTEQKVIEFLKIDVVKEVNPEAIRIANYKNNGYSNKKIAKLMKINEMAVSRKVKKYKELYPNLFV